MSRQAFHNALAHFNALCNQSGIDEVGQLVGQYVLGSVFLTGPQEPPKPPEEEYNKGASSTADVTVEGARDDPVTPTEPPDPDSDGYVLWELEKERKRLERVKEAAEAAVNAIDDEPMNAEDQAADWWKRKAVVRKRQEVQSKVKGRVFDLARNMDDSIEIGVYWEGAENARFYKAEDLEEVPQ